MTIPYRQHRVMRHIERELRRSDPHLAAMLVIFARLTAGEAITSNEQACRPGSWIRRGLDWLARAIMGVAARLSDGVRSVSRCVTHICAVARQRFRQDAHTAASRPSFTAQNPRDPKQSL